MERIALDFGIIQIYWYSIFIFLGILAASIVIYLEAKKKNISDEFLTNLIFTTVFFGIIGARLYYVLFNFSYYKNNIFEIFEIWNGGLAIHGGILFGSINVLYQCHKNRVESLKMFDIIVVGVILAQAIGRWGNFFNSEAYGAITTYKALANNILIPNFVAKGMYILGEYRQPTFYYESLTNLIGFIVLVVFRRKKYIKQGQITGLYFMWYSFFRIIIEGFRSDSLMLGHLKVAQIVSILLFTLGFILFIYYDKINQKLKLTKLYNDNINSNTFINDDNNEQKRQLFIK